MPDPIKIAMIGLDTSHTIAFTNLIQGKDTPDDQRVKGLQVVHAMRFPSAFQTEPDQDKRQAELEAMGVTMKPDAASALEGVDAVFLEINDPALHLEYFEQVVASGKPIFIDKPLAGSLADGKRIAELTATHNANVWGSSSLRYVPMLVDASKEVPKPLSCSTYGALGEAAAGSDLIWYGCHAVEMLNAAMGSGATAVLATQDELGVVLTVRYTDGRRGLVECNRGLYKYGGRVQDADNAIAFNADGISLYRSLLVRIHDWLQGGALPVSMQEMLEVLAILDAGERSLSSGQEESLGI